MKTLRQALHEYLSLRRNLGYKLREAGKALLDFVKFMEQQAALTHEHRPDGGYAANPGITRG